MIKIMIINGPNLNMLGIRETKIYGSENLADISIKTQEIAEKLGIELDFRQSNIEGEIIDSIHECAYEEEQSPKGLIINPGAYSHSSIAIMDAIAMLEIPKIEVHISNIYKREEFRHHSYVSKAVDGVISGLGSYGYQLALQVIFKKIKETELQATDA